jgi:hypothetical protein
MFSHVSNQTAEDLIAIKEGDVDHWSRPSCHQSVNTVCFVAPTNLPSNFQLLVQYKSGDQSLHHPLPIWLAHPFGDCRTTEALEGVKLFTVFYMTSVDAQSIVVIT